MLAQGQFLVELDRLRRDEGVAIVYITHDIASIAELADTIVVMYDGRIVERGPAASVLHRPQHPYTAALLACAPDVEVRRKLVPIPGESASGVPQTGCPYVTRCTLGVARCTESMPDESLVGPAHSVRCFESSKVTVVDIELLDVPASLRGSAVLEVQDLTVQYRQRGKVVASVDDVSLSVGRGECVAVVGASGSGKTTVARAVMGLTPARGGRVLLRGELLSSGIDRRTVAQMQSIQMVFQNPFESLNPRRSVLDQVARPAITLRGSRAKDADTAAQRLLDMVRLPAAKYRLLPRELSGGERQRVALARALVSDPEVLVCDEITSALDVSVQAAVLETLRDLSEQLGLAVLFITHDLGVVASIADRVVVLESGRVRETGTTDQVLRNPENDYTRELIAAAPRIQR
ncbi:oligopeptide/dipeptide ABC transporter ATP-binding protein [Aeromicrobium fastidiosum]|nr:oligopeptide/dipeptide ABC transporter ATP-binding protein [Aeromicrobium fastidiosum]